MENTRGEKTYPNWFWQDYFSTYRFWGAVFASFLVSLTESMSNSGIFMFLREEGLDFGIISASWPVANLMAIFVVLYFLRHSFKSALLIFALIVGISTAVMFSGFVKTTPLFFILKSLAGFGGIGFTISMIALLVSGRPTVGTFLITYSVVLFWTGVGGFLGSVLMAFALNYELPSFMALPALLAVFALLFMSSKMFSGAPDRRVEPLPVIKRSAGAVFLFSVFIPFYLLYWLFRRPGELKTLAPNLHQPTAGGALCMAIFAPFILPIWFHDIRAGLADRIPDRSPKLIAVIAFFIPSIAAAMAQSDNNALDAPQEEGLQSA